MKYTFLFLVFFSIGFSTAQNNTVDNFRYGFGLKLTGELQSKIGFAFRMSATGAIGNYYGVSGNDFGVLPTAHLGVLLYSKGILGSQLSDDYKNKVFLDVYSDFTFTAGAKHNTNRNRVDARRVALYHFSDFTANPLENTFQYSASIGSNFILNPDKNRSIQRIGFLNINIDRRFQLSYYNDGGPVLNRFGDKKDRYYTGGLVLSGHFDNHTEFNLIELSFHKFTGWQQYAFDVSDKLQLDHIPYGNEDVFGFNQQQWKLSVTNYRDNYSAYIKAYDVDVWDVQDILHFSRDNPYHPDYFYSYRIATGYSYNTFNTNN